MVESHPNTVLRLMKNSNLTGVVLLCASSVLGMICFRLGEPYWQIFVFAISPILLALFCWMDLHRRDAVGANIAGERIAKRDPQEIRD